MAARRDRLRIVAKTDVGCVRKRNEDSITWFESRGRFYLILADGMGGEAGGALASRTAVEACRQMIRSSPSSEPRELIARCFRAANAAILDKKRSAPDLQRMGTTLIVLVAEGERYWWGSAGDSRVHKVQRSGCVVTSRDHTVSRELYDNGTIRRSELDTHPQSHVLTRAVGIAEQVVPDIKTQPGTLALNEGVLLCSDGLSDVISTLEIGSLLLDHGPEKGVAKLVAKARSRGGPDNISILLIHRDLRRRVPIRRAVVTATVATILAAAIFGWHTIRSDREDSGGWKTVWQWNMQEGPSASWEHEGINISVRALEDGPVVNVALDREKHPDLAVETFVSPDGVSNVRLWRVRLVSVAGDTGGVNDERTLVGFWRDGGSNTPTGEDTVIALEPRLLFVAQNDSILVSRWVGVGQESGDVKSVHATGDSLEMMFPVSGSPQEGESLAGFDSLAVWVGDGTGPFRSAWGTAVERITLECDSEDGSVSDDAEDGNDTGRETKVLKDGEESADDDTKRPDGC